MLCVNVSINYIVDIGEILINRLTDIPEDGICEYVIRKPKGPWNDKPFMHDYNLGWFPLVLKVCKILEEGGYKTPHERKKI